MLGHRKRAFTLVELLVVIAIIGMLLSLGVLSVTSMMDSNKLWSAGTIFESAIVRSKSQAMSTRRACSLDIRDSMTSIGTQGFLISNILISEDFEQYAFKATGYSASERGAVVSSANIEEALFDEWIFYSPSNNWYLTDVDTRVLHHKGSVSSTTKPALAWNIAGGGERDVDSDNTLTTKFKVLGSLDTDGNWQVGAIAKMSRSATGFKGYRVRLAVEAGDDGWSKKSQVILEKLYNPGRNATTEQVIDGVNGKDAEGNVVVASRIFDDESKANSAIFTRNIWYRLKINARTQRAITAVSAKVWLDGTPEPVEWTVGPLYDYDAATLTTEEAAEASLYIDSFKGGDVNGAFVGLWVDGAEVLFDDVTMDAKENLPLTSGVRVGAIQYTVDPANDSIIPDKDADGDMIESDRYKQGGFPISFRPDGTVASENGVLVRLTNVGNGNVKYLFVNPHTGDAELIE